MDGDDDEEEEEGNLTMRLLRRGKDVISHLSD